MAKRERGDQQSKLGVLLAQARAVVGLTQQQLADKAGVSRKHISAIELGEAGNPGLETLRLLVRALVEVARERQPSEQAVIEEFLRAVRTTFGEDLQTRREVLTAAVG